MTKKKATAGDGNTRMTPKELEAFWAGRRAEREASAKPQTLTITLDREAAQSMAAGLSDVLCWASGFRAGRPDAPDLPLGIDETRRVSRLFQSALSSGEGKAEDRGEMPF